MRSQDVSVPTRLGKLLQEHRKAAGLTQKAVADVLGCSVVAISYYERGRRLPAPEVVERLAEALGLEADAREELLSCVRDPLGRIPDAEGILEEQQRILANPQISEPLKQRLLAQIQKTIESWRAMTQHGVQWAIVPVAGWQAMLLGAETIRKLVERSLDELREAGIPNCVVVVQPHQREVVRRDSNVRISVQEKTLGLGHAIAISLKQIPKHHPFAIVLPDESVEAGFLRSMVETYDRHRCSVVGLRDFDEGDEKYYGIAHLKEGCEIPTVVRLEEKPSTLDEDRFHPVVGRYVLSPDVFPSLVEPGAVEGAGKVRELTEILDVYARRQVVYGQHHKGKVVNLGGTRRTIKGQLDAFFAGRSEA